MEILFQGESRVVSKKSGDVVFGGTVVVEGSTLMKVIACGIWQCTLLPSFFLSLVCYILCCFSGDDSVLGKIVSTVQV